MALVRLYYDQQGIKVKIGVDEHEKKDNQRHIVDSSLCANGERIND
jgi:dihydroneopterin aldolase